MGSGGSGLSGHLCPDPGWIGALAAAGTTGWPVCNTGNRRFSAGSRWRIDRPRLGLPFAARLWPTSCSGPRHPAAGFCPGRVGRSGPGPTARPAGPPGTDGVSWSLALPALVRRSSDDHRSGMGIFDNLSGPGPRSGPLLAGLGSGQRRNLCTADAGGKPGLACCPALGQDPTASAGMAGSRPGLFGSGISGSLYRSGEQATYLWL